MKTLIKFSHILLFSLLIFSFLLPSSLFAIERRKEQFKDQFGYQILPFPYSLPGLGQGLGLWMAANNVFDTYTDFYLYKITGDVTGLGGGIDQLEIFPRTLFYQISQEKIDQATIMQYETRGMDTEKDDFKYLEGTDIIGRYQTLTLTFFDRMVDFYWEYFEQEYVLTKIRDNKGELILEVTNPKTYKYSSNSFGMMIDYTDDRQDPRKGIRFEATQTRTPPQNESEPDYYVMDYNTSLYFPVGKISTWAFNYFRSDAHVTKKGETDPAVIRLEQDLNCGGDPVCVAIEDQLVANQLAANTNGTSTSLGGRDRLRAYPDGRFKGAHTEFYGTELRLNLTEEFTPFDLYLIRDIRTGVQMAFFWEEGSVSEELSELGKDKRTSYGAGLRVVTGSGIVFRIDNAWGDEGSALTMIVDYPWGAGF